jgi:hypothetical protein
LISLKFKISLFKISNLPFKIEFNSLPFAEKYFLEIKSAPINTVETMAKMKNEFPLIIEKTENKIIRIVNKFCNTKFIDPRTLLTNLSTC